MTDSESVLDTKRIDADFNLVECLLLAKRKCGKGYLSTIREIRRLAKGIGKITPTEYFTYNLYDDNRYSPAEKAAFLGKEAVREFDVRILKNAWNHIAADKLVFYAAMQGLGLPVPETRAVYHGFRRFGSVPTLNDRTAMAEFLRGEIAYPLFGKPNGSVNSLGVAVIEAHDPSADELCLGTGERVAVPKFVEEIESFAKEGYIFQEQLRPHPDLVALCGQRMSSIRLYVMVGDRGVEIVRASWKIAVGDNPADNFWRPGNLLAAIDVASGRIERVVTGTGPKQREVESHPDTEKTLLGSTLPQWEGVKACCLAGAASLPACLVQGWDVAITERGPVLIELEGNGGHPQMVQAPYGQGLYQGSFKSFFDRHHEKARRRREERSKRWFRLPARARV